MNISLLRRSISLLLTLAVAVSGFPLRALATEETLPEPLPTESQPVETQPQETRPEVTEPEETRPEETQPEETQSEETQPEVTQPEETEPEETKPEETQPEETEPEETEPEETQPEETQPEETQPEETQPEETKPEETQPEETQPVLLAELEETPVRTIPNLWFGQLHAHTTISDGTQTPEALFLQAAQTEGLDFFAVTDFSDSFDGQDSGSITADASAVSRDWAAGKAAAAAVTSDAFLGIFGYEMGWPSQMKIGHISTFGTPGFQSWQQEPYRNYDGALEAYYETLAKVPGSVSQFHHPGTQYGTFQEFAYVSGAADRAVSLLELNGQAEKPLRYYIKALDQGWHLAPTGFARTVVQANALTEGAILSALGSCRAYTTGDIDLELLYSAGGFPMGSRLALRDLGDTLTVSLTVADPTDSGDLQAALITNGGETLLTKTLPGGSGTLSFSLPTRAGYYFLQLTQSDGDTAVTAPIWIDGEEELGIAGLTCETRVPVQQEAVELTLELYNNERADFLVDSLEILADGTAVAADTGLTILPAGSSFSHPLEFVTGSVGLTEITVVLTGTLEGSPRTYEASLMLSFHQSNQVTAIVADGSHGNAGIEDLNTLEALAMEENIRLTVAEEITPDILKNCRFLLVSAPSRPFSQAFLDAAAEFASYGGSLVICGQGDALDTGIHSAAELNRLLEAVGSTMRLRDDLARDEVNNGGDSTQIYTQTINTALSWCERVTEDQVYRHISGCTVDPGSGRWMVRGHSTTVSTDGDGDGLGGEPLENVTLLACETLSGGGTVFAAGSLFLTDKDLEEPRNIWDAPYANRSLGQQLLGIGGETIALSTIREAREGAVNTLFRVRGYVTAGTSNPYNTFPGMLYLQDDTGGIAVTPFSGAAIQQGTPLEVTGFAGVRNGNRILKLSSWKILDRDLYQYPVKQGPWPSLLDYDQNGGTLVQVEGACLEIYCREDGTLAGCLLEDGDGNRAMIKIEDYIFAGSDGCNDLHKTIRKGRTVRAMGLLHINEYGDTVIRVRNCEEVVWVPPGTYLNPRTGDRYLPAAAALLTISAGGLLWLCKRKRT